MSDAHGMAAVAGSRPSAVGVAVAGTIAVTAYAVWAVIHVLVLNPLAAVSGATLDQVYAEVAAAGDSLSEPLVFLVMAVGPVLAVVWLVRAVRRRDSRPLEVAVGYLALLMVGALAYFVASFGAGMALADTFGISGGDHSPWAGPLYLTSGLALVGLLALAAVRRVRRPAFAHSSPK